METLDKTSINKLLSSTATPAVTIYAPMHTTASPPHLTENQIRLKNLLHNAASQLKPHGVEAKLAASLEAKVAELHDDLAFWESQTPGLLICATPDFIRFFNLPIDTEEYVAIDSQFHLAPVLGLLEDAQEFYVLALAQHSPLLYKGNMYGMELAEINLPTSKEKALNIDENNQKSELQGTATGRRANGNASSPASGRGWYNGRGGARNPQEEDRMRYLRMIDQTLLENLDTKLPLMLAGIDSEIAEYRSISKYPHIMQQSISGNHTMTSAEELFKNAMLRVRREIIEPRHEAAVEEYTRLSGANPERVENHEQTIAKAAEEGRIDKLLAAIYRSTADTVRDGLNDVIRITFPDKETSRTLNRLAVTVWQMSGKIINLLPSQIPNGQLMVARLRY